MLRSLRLLRRCWLLLLAGGLVTCVRPFEPKEVLRATVLVVDGGLTDSPGKQVVRLGFSVGDSLTGRPGTRPVDDARVELVVDSSRVVALRPAGGGAYQFPNGFVGQAGHRYQLRFSLRDGRRYASSVETMPAVPPILGVYDRFNARSVTTETEGLLLPANDVFVDLQDPAGVRNHYRWDWTLWERQEVCASCQNGEYYINDPQGNLLEGCIPDPRAPNSYVLPIFRDYRCRTACWEILFSAQLNLFADTYTDGGPLTGWLVARIPFYQNTPALVEIRQSALTLGAYRYYKLLDEQTQKTGGLADTPPVPPIGNVRNLADDTEPVVGYFTASSVATVRYWLDRRGNTGAAIDLFEFFNGRKAAIVPGSPIRGRPPLAVCAPSDSRTPVKPEGWRE